MSVCSGLDGLSRHIMSRRDGRIFKFRLCSSPFTISKYYFRNWPSLALEQYTNLSYELMSRLNTSDVRH